MEDQEMRNELLKSKVKDEQEATSQSKASINFVYQTQMIKSKEQNPWKNTKQLIFPRKENKDRSVIKSRGGKGGEGGGGLPGYFYTKIEQKNRGKRTS